MKKLMTSLLCLALMAALAVPTGALEYTVDAPAGPEYGRPTSIEPVITTDRGEAVNEDRSKNSALIPPAFGSASAYALNTGTILTPNLNPTAMPSAGAVISGSIATVPSVPSSPVVGFTAVTDDLYYSGGYLGTLRIPSIGVNVKIYEGTDPAQLARGAGHFEETSIWDGNVALAGHNRGVNEIFGQIHTLQPGTRITLTTRLGTRTYEVVSVSKISETDRSGLALLLFRFSLWTSGIFPEGTILHLLSLRIPRHRPSQRDPRLLRGPPAGRRSQGGARGDGGPLQRRTRRSPPSSPTATPT